MTELSQAVKAALACPSCRHSLCVRENAAACKACGSRYPRSPRGQLDLRLESPRPYPVEFCVGGPSPPLRATGQPIPLNPNPEFDYAAVPLPTDLTRGNRLTRPLLSYFPHSRDGGLMLDLGCGGQQFRQVCTQTNLEYLGMDYGGDTPPLLGDVHALPFADASFKFVISFATVEHFRNPFVAMREIHRVLQPGAMFIGTVAFLEPFHLNSYFHPTPLGTQHLLESGGFEIVHLEPNADWMGPTAQAWMSLFPHSPMLLARALVWPLMAAHRLWWKLGHALQHRPQTSESARRLVNTAGFRFICRKPIATKSRSTSDM